MKLFVVTFLFAVCAAAQAATINNLVVPMLEAMQISNHSSKIINGLPASKGQFPWQVEVRIGGSGLCGGSLISPRWILTAAHCVDASYWEVKVGGIRRGDNNELSSFVTSTRNKIAHERYNPSNLNNDIALIKLNEDIPLSDTIQTIRLPARSEVNNPLENIQVTISGYGKTGDWAGVSNNLMYVNLNTISNAKCAETYGKSIIVSSTLCTKAGRTQGTCNGDSGGPLIRIAEDGKPTQVGVVSFVSSAGCESGYPAGFVRTASFLNWIHEKTGIPIRN